MSESSENERAFWKREKKKVLKMKVTADSKRDPRIPLFLASISSTMGKLSEPSPITPLAFTHVLWFIIYINVEILYDSTTTGFHKPTINYLLTLQLKRCSQRCNRKTKFSQVWLAIYKLTLQTKPNHRLLDHQRLKGIKFTNISIYSVLATCK